MCDLHSHIFIEMEGGDEVPIDILGFYQMVDHLELGRARGDNDIRMATLADGLANESGPKLGRFLPRFDFIG
jgi:hypothetical protein